MLNILLLGVVGGVLYCWKEQGLACALTYLKWMAGIGFFLACVAGLLYLFLTDTAYVVALAMFGAGVCWLVGFARRGGVGA